MSPPLSEQSVFLEALQLTGAEARKAYLDAVCEGNTELRGRVEALLRADEQAGDFLVRPPEGLTGDDAKEPERGFSEDPGDRIHRYKLLEKIGEGGCGEVYMAQQEEPVRRRVALKIIKLGMDTRSVIARFEAERQALALLDHPNIAKVFDGGATQSGRLYFVMELVRGVRITDFCKQTNLGIVARLGLFNKVCQAVQHAHQKGIIHRDLKPANILVTVNDGEAVPKVIDFGIAKATGERLTDKTLFTQFHAFIGTPAYTSPEQAEMSSVDIDTRSDIYSLGVLLYELLTDRTPFDGQELLRSGVDEMRRVIREVQPLRPSTRISKLLETEAREQASACEKQGTASDLATQSSGQRLIQEKKILIKHVRGDLDWIVMKCLEKDRGRRYETASGLAADIQRHLNHEPIHARPVNALGRVQRWRQRHPTVALLTGSVLFLLVVVAVGALTAAWRLTAAHQAEHLANRELRKVNSRLAETVSVLKLQAAEEQFRRHDSSMGVAQLAAILRHDPRNEIAGSRLISALLYRNWALPSSSSMGHVDRITSVSFSPDGRYLLSSSFDKTAKIWDASTGKTVATLQHRDNVLQASFSSDGTRVITASADGTATIWNASNGTRLVTLGQHSKRVWSAEFSPNGKAAVTAAEGENTVQVWDSETGALTREIPNPDSEVLMARYSPDGSVIAGGTQSGTIVVWQTGSGESMRLKGHAGGIVLLAFSANGQSLISVDAVHSARVWDSHSGRPLGPPLPHPSGVGSAALSPDGQVAITTSPNNTARLWSMTKGELLHKLQHEGIVVSGAFSPDGKTVVTTSMDNSARLWDVETGLPVCQPLREHEGILLAGFNPDGVRVVTASRDHTVQVWTIERKHPLGMTMRHEKRVTSVAFTPDGKAVLSASADHAAKLSNATTGEQLTKPMCHPSPVQWAELSPDGSRIVTACEDGTVYIWDSNTGDLLVGPIRHNGEVWNAQFSPDGERIVTASSDGTAAIWDSTTGQLLMPPLEHGALVNSARFSPNGRLLVTASENWCARVWDSETGQPVTEPLRHGDNVEWAEFSPDGGSVVSASSDNTARIWDARTGKPIGMQLQHARTVLKAVFSPDSQLVATGSLDGTVRIWNARTGQPVTAPIVHEFAVTQVCFSAEGRRLLTSSWAAKSRLWDVQTGLPLTEWIDAGGFGFSSRFDEFGQRVVSGAQSGLVQIWDTPTLPLPVPAWFIGLVEAVAGTRYSEDGNVELVPREELDQLRQRLTPESKQGLYGSVGRWLLR